MTHRERIAAAIAGEKMDKIPIALWRHFPQADQSAQGLAEAAIAFQKRFDFDLVKVTPASGYPAEAWGAKLQPKDNEEGTRDYLSRPIHTSTDWHSLQPLDVRQGVLGRELRALKLVRTGVGPKVPVLETIFSPLTIAKQLSGELWLKSLREDPGALEAGLKIIAETTARFAQASLESGADAIFFATQLASHDLLSIEEYRTFGLEYDRQVLDAVRNKAAFILLHLHGTNPMFELLDEYHAQIINWHDRRTQPSLKQAKELLRTGALLGGLDEWGALSRGNQKDVLVQAQDAIVQTAGRRLILGAGCVTLITTPETNIKAACEAARAES
jgi:uroporphyrinogen decarboxylase